jgi:hypothetical protein
MTGVGARLRDASAALRQSCAAPSTRVRLRSKWKSTFFFDCGPQ